MSEFDLRLHYMVPLAAALIYATLFVVVIVNRPLKREHKLFLFYITAAILWSSSDFLLRSNFLSDNKLLLFQLVVGSSILWMTQLYVFTRSFLHGSRGFASFFGYAALLIFIVLAFLGLAPPSLTVGNGNVNPQYGAWFAFYLLPVVSLPILGIVLIVKKLKQPLDPEYKNRVYYLLASICILAGLGFLGISPASKTFPFSHLGGLISALIITISIIRDELVSINIVMRRLLGNFSLALIGIAIFTAILVFGITFLKLPLVTATAIYVIVIGVAVSAFVFWIRPRYLGKIDQLFFRNKYEVRRDLFNFVHHGITGVSGLEELGERLLSPLCKLLDCHQGYLILPATTTGDFIGKFSTPSNEDFSSFRIQRDSSILKWLEKGYLTKKILDINAFFRGQIEEERNYIKKFNIELIYPLVSKSNLIGILAFGKKNNGEYEQEEINLLDDIANRIAMTMEKEHLQDELKKQKQELALINRLSGVMTSSLNLQDVYEIFVSGLREVVKIDCAHVVVSDGSGYSVLASSSTIDVPWKIEGEIQGEGTGIEWVVQNQRSVYEPDISNNHMFVRDDEYRMLGLRSIVFLPLLAKGDGIGCLVIGSTENNSYNPEQINLLERLAAQISTSVENSKLYSKAQQRARVDELTGLFNRRHFDENLKLEINRHSRYGSSFSLIFMDLDNFKSHNDFKGHTAGDKVLISIGRLIRDSIRDIDLPCRYGGDEFAVILPNSSSEQALMVAERVNGKMISSMKNLQAAVTMSMGIASWPSDALSATDLINAADRALYYAKQTGGNRICDVAQMLPTSNESDASEPVERETLNTIYALAATIEARDRYTYGHSRKVRAYAVELAEKLHLPTEKVALIGHAALLHDIGKIGIMDEILNKPGKLTNTERELMKSHPQFSRNIVAHIASLTSCLPAILYHHERWDGKGYPEGLKGDAIPLEARILAIADAFDAMTSLRPYRAPLSLKEAVSELSNNSGVQFDPAFVKEFIPIALSAKFDSDGVMVPIKPKKPRDN